MNRYPAPLLFCLVVAGACGSGGGGRAGVVVDDSVSLDGVRALANAVGIQELFARVARPDPFLTDFFGIQPLQPVPTDRILSDLVPVHADLIERGPHALVLQLHDGPRVRFMIDTRLVVNGDEVSVPYARIETTDSASYPADGVAFRALIVEAGLASAYLVPNPYDSLEQIVMAVMTRSDSIASPTTTEDRAAFARTAHAVRIIGETHGGTDAYDRAWALLESPDVDWIGIEMLGEDLQDAVNRYVTAGDVGAREQLLDYYRHNWNTRGHEVTADPADNPYFRLIEKARQLGKPVHALDATAQYILFRYGEFPLGATVRDAVWARNIPATGRGLAYGGSAHFAPDRRPNMLTFLQERDSAILVVR